MPIFIGIINFGDIIKALISECFLMNTNIITKGLCLVMSGLLLACAPSRTKGQAENYMPVLLSEGLLDSINSIPFDRIVASSAIKLHISQGDRPSLEVHSPNSDVSGRLDVRVDKGELQLSLRKKKLSLSTITKGEQTLLIYLQLPQISSIDARGACDIEVKGNFKGKDLGIALSGASELLFEDCKLQYQRVLCQLSGASELEIKELQSEELVLISEGASEVELQGKCEKITAMVYGASDAELNKLEVQTASVELQGASKLELWVSKLLNYRVNGASTLHYRGAPELGTTSCQGASSVRKH